MGFESMVEKKDRVREHEVVQEKNTLGLMAEISV